MVSASQVALPTRSVLPALASHAIQTVRVVRALRLINVLAVIPIALSSPTADAFPHAANPNSSTKHHPHARPATLVARVVQDLVLTIAWHVRVQLKSYVQAAVSRPTAMGHQALYPA